MPARKLAFEKKRVCLVAAKHTPKNTPCCSHVAKKNMSRQVPQQCRDEVAFGEYKGSDERPADDYLAWLSTRDLREPLRMAVRIECQRRLGTNRNNFSQDFEWRFTGDDRKIARRIVETGRRALAKTAHPDTGGEHAAMQRINVVADAMLEGLG